MGLAEYSLYYEALRLPSVWRLADSRQALMLCAMLRHRHTGMRLSPSYRFTLTPYIKCMKKCLLISNITHFPPLTKCRSMFVSGNSASSSSSSSSTFSSSGLCSLSASPSLSPSSSASGNSSSSA